MGMGFLRVVVGDDPYEAVERGKPMAKKHKEFYVLPSGLPRRYAPRNDGENCMTKQKQF
jgi:hypothetical protein